MPPEPDGRRDRPSNGRAPVLLRFHDDVRAAASVGSGVTDRPNERERGTVLSSEIITEKRTDGRRNGESTCLLLFLHASQLLPRHIAEPRRFLEVS